MKAGKLRHRITIEKNYGDDQDAQGHVTEDWQAFDIRWAAVEPIGGRELWNARQLQPDITHRVRIRWDSKADTITADMRIDYRGRILHLLEPPRKIQEERNIELEFLCREAK